MGNNNQNYVAKNEEHKVSNSLLQIAAFLVLVFSLSVVFLAWLPDSTNSDSSAVRVMNFLMNLPLNPRFYLIIIVLFCIWLARHWYLRSQLPTELEIRKQIDQRSKLFEERFLITLRDYRVVRTLRIRALNLRAATVLIFGSVFALLFGGFYIISFGLQQLGAIDQFLVEQRQTQLIFEERFGNNLDIMDDGLYWLKTSENYSRIRGISYTQILTFSGVNGLLVYQDGSTFATADGGETWRRPAGLALKPDERVFTAMISADGVHGAIVGNQGSAFVTTDGGMTWTPLTGLALKPDESIVEAEFSDDGVFGVIVGDEGSTFATTDSGMTWTRSTGLALKSAEFITNVEFSDDGVFGVIVGDEGSTFATTDSGMTWTRSTGLALKQDERVFTVMISADGGHGAIVGDEGSTFATTNGGMTWTRSTGLALKSAEYITNVEFSADGVDGVIIGNQGSAFGTTDDSGNTWKPLARLELGPYEGVVTAIIHADKTHGMIVGDEGSTFATTDSGKTWKPLTILELKVAEFVMAAEFSDDGAHGVIVGDEGSTFATTDSGMTWTRSTGLELRPGESIVEAEFSDDGAYAVIVGNNGSVFVTETGGQFWEITVMDNRNLQLEDLVIVQFDDETYTALAVDRLGEGGSYLLKKHKDMEKWRTWSLLEIKNTMEKNQNLLNSKIYNDINNLLTKPDSFIGNVNNSDNSAGNNSNSIFVNNIDDLTVIRTVGITILFFLVQVLIRLAQYCLRLASFWDSRADAVLLAQSFAEKEAESFDDLVYALAPDTYDFKPTPKSMLDRLRSQKEQ